MVERNLNLEKFLVTHNGVYIHARCINGKRQANISRGKAVAKY